MSEYTPTTDWVRYDYIRGTATDAVATEPKLCACGNLHPVESQRAKVSIIWDSEARKAAPGEFDRWLAAELAAAKAEALREAAEAYPAITRDMVSRGSVRAWLSARALVTAKGEQSG